jgi:hypothetical protein
MPRPPQAGAVNGFCRTSDHGTPSLSPIRMCLCSQPDKIAVECGCKPVARATAARSDALTQDIREVRDTGSRGGGTRLFWCTA